MNIDLIESPWKSVLVDGSVRELVPLGLGYIASSLIELTGHIPRILSPKIEQVDGNLEKWITDNLILHSDIVGISATTDTFLSALKIAESIRRLNNEVTIVLGGSVFTPSF